MMGRSHAKQGVCAALVLGTALMTTDVVTPPEPSDLAISAILLISGATWADIDSKGSHATKSFGYITYLLHLITHYITRLLYDLTRGGKDREKKGSHRLLTHTLLGNLAAGLVVVGLCYIDRIVAAVVAGLLVGMAASVFFRKAKYLVAVVAGVGVYLLPEISPWVWGAAFAIGNAVHCFGDSCTVSGTPWFWPLVRDGKRWGNYHVLPEYARISTGKQGEPVLMTLTYLLTAVAIGAIVWVS